MTEEELCQAVREFVDKVERFKAEHVPGSTTSFAMYPHGYAELRFEQRPRMLKVTPNHVEPVDNKGQEGRSLVVRLYLEDGEPKDEQDK